MKTVNILGQEYKIVESSEKEEPKLVACNAIGICERYAKEIIVDVHTLDNPTSRSAKNLPAFKKQVLRHEIMHAIFHESGMSEFSENERLVELLSIQLPKIFKVCEELDILD